MPEEILIVPTQNAALEILNIRGIFSNSNEQVIAYWDNYFKENSNRRAIIAEHYFNIFNRFTGHRYDIESKKRILQSKGILTISEDVLKPFAKQLIAENDSLFSENDFRAIYSGNNASNIDGCSLCKLMCRLSDALTYKSYAILNNFFFKMILDSCKGRQTVITGVNGKENTAVIEHIKASGYLYKELSI